MLAKLFLQEFPEALAWFLSQGFSDPGPYQGRGGGEQAGLREGQGHRETKAEPAMEVKQRDDRVKRMQPRGYRRRRWAGGSEGAYGRPAGP